MTDKIKLDFIKIQKNWTWSPNNLSVEHEGGSQYLQSTLDKW